MSETNWEGAAAAVAPESNRLLLIAQSDPAVTASLAYYLARAGYDVTTASGADEVRRLVGAKPHDLLVLDPSLPDLSGYALLEELRRDAHTRDLGVILMSATPAQLDGVRGLSLGADDCVSAPISPEELVLRVGAIIRRRHAGGASPGRRMRVGPVVLDHAAHRVTVNGDDVPVTITEFKILTTLMQQAGRVCTRQRLLESVWQTEDKVQTRTVDMHLQRLRRKLGRIGDYIETVRGAGYRLRTERAAEG